MQSADLYIIAAGHGSRMRMFLPKALVPIVDDRPCLTTTLTNLAHKFRHVFVVGNMLAESEWQLYFDTLREESPHLVRNVIHPSIESGLGDGHAVRQGIAAAERSRPGELSDEVVITWGDVFFRSGRIMDELLGVALRGSGLLPACWEINPYVTLLVNEEMQCASVEFSKYGERRPVGYHDQSVFRFSRAKLVATLSALHSALWKGGRYIAPGGEMSLLYAMHHLFNIGDPVYVYETRHPTLSFNTVEEMMAIQRDLNSRSPAEVR